MDMHEVIMRIIRDLLYVIITIGGGFLIRFLINKIGNEKLAKFRREIALHQDIALLAVKAVEQIWSGVLHGDEKVEKAIALMTASFNKLKITTVTEEEMRSLVEWAVRTLKDEFGEEWGKIPADPGTGTDTGTTHG